MSRIFSDRVRTHDGPADHAEETFVYLDRSARADVGHVRDLLEEWFSRFPTSEKSDLATRFQVDFDAAFLELFLHETYHRCGYTLTPHPTLSNTAKHPDFLVEKGDERFYLEAKVARDRTAKEEARESTENILFDAINQVDSRNYYVYIKRFELLTPQQPSLNDIKSFLVTHLPRHPPPLHDAPSNALNVDSTVTLEYRSAKLVADFKLIPRSSSARGSTDTRTIGIYPTRSRVGGTKEAILSAVRKKAARYGNLDLPYIVAVNCVSQWGVRSDDVLDALFGSEQLAVSRDLSTVVPSRAQNGAWISTSGPVNRRVSAALITSIYPWSLSDAKCYLVHNPWALKPIDGLDHPFMTGRVIGSQVVWSERIDLLDYFGLPDNWPQAG